jgi:hypothetical protein
LALDFLAAGFFGAGAAGLASGAGMGRGATGVIAGGGGAGGVGAGRGDELGIGSIHPEPDHPISISWNTAMLFLRGSRAARPAVDGEGAEAPGTI